MDGFYDVVNTGPLSFDPSRAFALAFLRAASRTPAGRIFEAGEGAFRLKGEDIPPRNLLDHIFTLLDNDRCANFVSNLINVARQLTGKKPFTYDGKKLALAVAKQINGGFILRPGASGGGGGGSAYGDIFSGEATVEITMFNTAYGPRHPVRVQYAYALAALHELLHLAGGGASFNDGSRAYYSDVVLAQATYILTGAPGYPKNYNPTMPWYKITAQMTADAGNYWNDQLKEHCKPQEYYDVK